MPEAAAAVLAVVLGFIALAVVAFAADLPGGGTSLLPGDALQAMQVLGASKVEERRVDAIGQPFQSAVEFRLPGQVGNPWDVLYACTIQQAIRKGDVLHLRIYARCVQSLTGSATISIICQMGKQPWNKPDFHGSLGSEWTVIDMPFVAERDSAPGESHFYIRLGCAGQIIQLGGIQLLNYGQGFDQGKLPVTPSTYVGREADAPWRQAAAERIEKIRKADLHVMVRDAAGKPLPQARVHVLMTRHEFPWGTCVGRRALLGNTPDCVKFRETLKKYFNQAIIENELKWSNIEERGYQDADRMIAWLLENNLTVRGHNLIWPGRENLPPKAVALMDKPDDLRSLCAAHITETAARYTGKLVDWDVINEPHSNHDVQDRLGKQEMVRWFKRAKAADPKARLYLNTDAILETGNALDTSQQKFYVETIRYLLDQGAPLEGIGLEGHFESITDPEHLLKILDRFAQFHLPIKVTELDIRLEDEGLRADYMRDLITILFSYPSVVGVLQWGFFEKFHWRPDTAIIDANWNLRPHGQAWADLVHKQWKTDMTQPTGATGELAVRGFKGDYEITVTTSDGKTARKSVRLSDGGTEVIVTVE